MKFHPFHGIIARWLTPKPIPSAWDIDDAVSEWHIGAGGQEIELFDFLGWSFDEYIAWVRNPDAIPPRPLSEVAAQAIVKRIAERSAR